MGTSAHSTLVRPTLVQPMMVSSTRVRPTTTRPSLDTRPAAHTFAPPATTVRFGNYLSATLAPFYQGVTDFVADRLHIPTTLETGSAYGQLAAGEVDAGFL